MNEKKLFIIGALNCILGFLVLCFSIQAMFPPKPKPFQMMAFNDPRRAIMLQDYYARKDFEERESQKQSFLNLLLRFEELKKKIRS